MFYIRLRQLREELGLTQEDVAKMLNLTQSTIAYYESGRKMPTLENANLIAKFFDTSLDYLTGLSNNPFSSKTNNVILSSTKLLIDINNLSSESQKDLKDFISFLKFRDSNNKKTC